MVICQICGQTMVVVTNTHLKYQHNMNHRDYDRLLGQQKVGLECQLCHRILLKLRNHICRRHKVDWRDYCASYPDSQPNHESYLADCRRRMLKRHNVSGTRCSICKSNRHTTPEHSHHVSLAAIGKHSHADKRVISENSKRMWCNPQSRAKLMSAKRFIAISDGNKRRWRDEDYRLKQNQARIRNRLSSQARMRAFWADPLNRERQIRASLNGQGKKPSMYENRIMKVSAENALPLSYTGNGKRFINGCAPDFVIDGGLNGAVEVFHDYWKIKNYGSVSNYVKIRGRVLGDGGYNTLFISDGAIKNSALLKDTISEFIDQVKYNKVHARYAGEESDLGFIMEA